MSEWHIILNWASIHKADLLGIVGGTAGLSVFLESLLLKLKIDSHALALTLLHVFAALSALAAWYLSSSLTGPAAAGVYASLVIVAEIWQRFAVSPAFKKFIVPFLTWLSDQKTSTVPVSTPAPVVNQLEGE